jgi:predicted GIY-YIG superfamily endonuclease
MYIYLLKCPNDEPEYIYKIGFTTNIKNRMKQHKTSNPYIEVVFSFETKHNRKLETYFHNIYKHKKILNEWFSLKKEDVDSFLIKCEKMEKTYDNLKKENPYY